ncbi:MAG: aromatic ring-hydroxylating dioxygenase subunit alpha [Fimbriimonadaceae bacterium]
MLDFTVHEDIREAATPPTRFYTDPHIYEACLDKVLARSWQWIGHTDAVKVPGQTHPITLLEGSLNEPLLLTRDTNDQIHLISNVCTHRGNIVCEAGGNERFLRCRYHGRRFGLDGKFQSMPEFEGVCGFPSPADDLPNVQHGFWGPFIFASLSPAGELDEVLQPMRDRVGWLPLDQFVYEPTRAREYLVKGHWALYCDNYLEGFHIPFIHAALTSALDYGNYTTELYRYSTLQLGVAADAEQCFYLPESSPDHGKNIAAYYYWLFPNMMFNFYPWGLSINVVRPLAPDLTKVSFYPYVWQADKLRSGAGADLDRVEREDEAVIELVQKGIKSRMYDRGRYSTTRETGTHHFHRLLVEFLS